jgi:hypothetical protein
MPSPDIQSSAHFSASIQAKEFLSPIELFSLNDTDFYAVRVWSHYKYTARWHSSMCNRVQVASTAQNSFGSGLEERAFLAGMKIKGFLLQSTHHRFIRQCTVHFASMLSCVGLQVRIPSQDFHSKFDAPPYLSYYTPIAPATFITNGVCFNICCNQLCLFMQ